MRRLIRGLKNKNRDLTKKLRLANKEIERLSCEENKKNALQGLIGLLVRIINFFLI